MAIEKQTDCKANQDMLKSSGCSAVRLAHLLWEQGVVGSNPATPTINKDLQINRLRVFSLSEIAS